LPGLFRGRNTTTPRIHEKLCANHMPGYNRNEGHILNVLVDHLISDVHNYRHTDHFKIKSLNVTALGTAPPSNIVKYDFILETCCK
jgi:hypothetical protein